MKRWQRKQRIKEQRLAQKEARKRKRLEAQAAEGGTGGPTQADATAQTDGTVAPACPGLAEAADQPVEVEGKVNMGEAAHTAPTLMPAYTVDEAVADVKQANGQARESLRQSKLVSEEEAAEMLSEAARDISDVIQAGRRALAQVSPRRLAEATEAVNAPGPAVTGGTPQQRPRRGTDPVITLMKLIIQASNLLQRVLFRLHPRLRRAA